jgi:hypothetical protein
VPKQKVATQRTTLNTMEGQLIHVRVVICFTMMATTICSGLTVFVAVMKRTFMHLGTLCLINCSIRTKPAAGAEYMIKMCRSTSATGSFVDSNGVSCLKSGGNILLESHGYVYGPGGQ